MPAPTQTPTRTPPSPTPTLTRDCWDGAALSPLIDTSLPIDESILIFLQEQGGFVPLMEILASMCGDVWGLSDERPYSQVLITDVDADGNPDVLVAVTLPYGGGYGEAHVVLYLHTDDGVVPQVIFRRSGAGSRAEGLYEGGGPEILDVTDLNRNGSKDIALVVRWDIFAELYLWEWTGDGFRRLIESENILTLEADPRLTLREEQPSLEDLNGDGRLELLLSSGLPLAGEPITEPIERIQVWSWNGTLYESTSTTYSIEPTYRIEAIYLGDFAFLNADFDQALAFYQQAVFDEALLGWSPGFDPATGQTPTADPNERARLNAYGRYRILLTHAVQGNRAEAQTVYDSLIQRIPPGSPGEGYVLLAATFWESYAESGSFYGACGPTIRYASRNTATVLDPLSLYYGEYGRTLESDDICPFPQLQAQ